MIKQCSSCKKQLTLNNFNKEKATKDGLSHKCRLCKKEYKEIYKCSLKGVLVLMYHNQIVDSKKRKMSPPTYTQKEFISKFINDLHYNQLHIYWLTTKEKNDKPSVDRLNDNISYTLNNIQMVTHKINQDKQNTKVKMGINKNSTNKRITQLTIENVEIASFVSLHAAGEETKVAWQNISKVIRGLRKTAGGFKWKLIK